MTSDSDARSDQVTLEVSRGQTINVVTRYIIGDVKHGEISLGFWVRDEFSILLWLWGGGMVPTVTLYLENS